MAIDVIFGPENHLKGACDAHMGVMERAKERWATRKWLSTIGSVINCMEAHHAAHTIVVDDADATSIMPYYKYFDFMPGVDKHITSRRSSSDVRLSRSLVS